MLTVCFKQINLGVNEIRPWPQNAIMDSHRLSVSAWAWLQLCYMLSAQDDGDGVWYPPGQAIGTLQILCIFLRDFGTPLSKCQNVKEKSAENLRSNLRAKISEKLHKSTRVNQNTKINAKIMPKIGVKTSSFWMMKARNTKNLHQTCAKPQLLELGWSESASDSHYGFLANLASIGRHHLLPIVISQQNSPTTLGIHADTWTSLMQLHENHIVHACSDLRGAFAWKSLAIPSLPYAIQCNKCQSSEDGLQKPPLKISPLENPGL